MTGGSPEEALDGACGLYLNDPARGSMIHRRINASGHWRDVPANQPRNVTVEGRPEAVHPGT
jgi:hypothetical protein